MIALASLFSSLAYLIAATTATPHSIPRAPGQVLMVHTPSALYNIYPNAPDLSKESLGFHLETWNNASQVEQVLVFDRIPSTAKDCSVGWQQGNRTDRLFIAKGSNALAGVRQLSGFPDKSPVTYNTIKPFDTAAKDLGAADFTNWDDLQQQGHIVGGIDCAETLYLKAALRDPDGNTKVFLEQDEENGLYITYTFE